MGIFDGIEDDIRRGPLCRVAILLDAFDKADRAAFAAVLANRNVPSTAITKRLAGAGHRVADDAIARHRRGACACR